MKKYLILIALIFAANTQAKTYQLKELIELAKVHPEVEIESFEVEKAKTLFERIDGETRPKLTILSGIGPNKSVTGNALSTTQSTKIDTVTYLTKIDLQIPVFGFNRQKDLIAAATGNQKVKELDVLKKRTRAHKKSKRILLQLSIRFEFE